MRAVRPTIARHAQQDVERTQQSVDSNVSPFNLSLCQRSSVSHRLDQRDTPNDV